MLPIRHRAVALAAVAASAAVLSACSGGSDAVDQEAAGQYRFVAGDGTGKLIAQSARRSAPTFGGTLVGGGSFASSSLSGHVAVLNFWGSWCGPCRVETPEFEKVYEATRSRGVEFLGIDVKDAESAAKAFLDDKHIAYPSVFDQDGRVALAFRHFPPNAIPSTIVLDRHGRVAAVFLGQKLAGDIQPVVERLAAES